jgi:type IV fimbrial biogenesis protein FimT
VYPFNANRRSVIYRTSEVYTMQNNQGFTLIEMMIAILIAAILISVGIPSFFDLIQRNSVSTASNELVSALLYARSEAVRQESDVTFALAESGWTVKVDDTDDIVLEYVLESSQLSVAEVGDTITYNARGRASVSTGDSIDISYKGTLENRICLNLIGRPYSKKVTDGDCP